MQDCMQHKMLFDLNPFTRVCAVVLIFLAGRWSSGSSCQTQPKPLPDVTDEVREHLYAPPKGHGAVAVPSVNSDARGEIHNLLIGGARFNILVSYAGSMRSGDVHRSRQLDLIFAGRVAVTTRERGRDVRREYGSGSLIEIPANVPHIFDFLNDTVMAEWWPDASFEARYYRPYRRRVDRANAAIEEAARARKVRGGGRASRYK